MRLLDGIALVALLLALLDVACDTGTYYNKPVRYTARGAMANKRFIVICSCQPDSLTHSDFLRVGHHNDLSAVL